MRLAGEEQRERVGRDHDRHHDQGNRHIAKAHTNGRCEGEERIDRADEQDADLLRQEREAGRASRGVQPCRPVCERVASEQEQRQRREERLGAVQQQLSADENVVRHQRDQHRRHHSRSTSVEGERGAVRQKDRREPGHGGEQAAPHVSAAERERNRDDRLEEKRMRPKNGEQVLQLWNASDRRALARVDGLVAVVPQSIDVPEAKNDARCESESHGEGDDDRGHARAREAAGNQKGRRHLRDFGDQSGFAHSSVRPANVFL